MVDGEGIGVGMGMHIAEVKIDYDNWCLASRWLGAGGGKVFEQGYTHGDVAFSRREPVLF